MGQQEKQIYLKYFADRLRHIMLRRGMSPREFASFLGVGYSTLTNWLNAYNGATLRKKQELAEKLGCSVEFLDGIPTDSTGIVVRDVPRNGQGPYYGRSIEAPVVSMAQAGSEWHSFEDLFCQSGEKYPTSCRDENCFWLRIVGDSMLPRFEPGDLVMLMPNSEARNGDLAVVRTVDGGVHFKVFHWTPDLKQLRLTSLNTIYSDILLEREGIKWIYPVHSVLSIIRY